MNTKQYLNKIVTVKMDRPLGTKHPKHGFVYETNYGYIPGTMSGDGEELDAYVLCVDEPIDEFTGRCIAIIHRTDDDDDKLVVVPDGFDLADETIESDKAENNNTLVRALAYAWKYKREIENGLSVRKLATKIKHDHRTVYKYLNLYYLSPRIINTIMEGNAPTRINLQTLFDIASKHEKFQEQEKIFYC